MTRFNSQYPHEDLVRHTVYAFIYASCSGNTVDNHREEIVFEVLADQGDTLTAKVVNKPQFSNYHHYKQGDTHKIPKHEIDSYTRSLKQFQP